MAGPAEDIHKANVPRNIPESNFPEQALQQTVQKFPDGNLGLPISGTGQLFTLMLASAADSITPWGRAVSIRDRQLRDFFPTEPYLAGAVANVSFRNAAYDWKIKGPSSGVEEAITDILMGAIAGSDFGWSAFVKRFSEDLYTQDNGAFIELIRDPGQDANSQFKDERAPVLGIANLDANQCTRTGDPETPVTYTDRQGTLHRLQWFQVIPFAEFASAIEKMNGVGYCAVTRALRLAQILRSIFIFKDEKISGRHFKSLHFVSGVSRTEIDTVLQRGQEEADNKGMMRFILPAVLASLDPEKPVSVASIDLAALPDNFDLDQELRWYISGLALDFGVDYQEFAPLPGGNIGSSQQSIILSRKSSGKGPAMFMKIAEAFSNYGVLPRGCKMIFEDRDEQKELDRQTLRRMFQEEMALALRNGFIDPDSARALGIARGLYDSDQLSSVPKGYGRELAATTIRENLIGATGDTGESQGKGLDKPVPAAPAGPGLPKQNVGPTGGNTIAENATRTGGGAPNTTGGGQLRKETNNGSDQDHSDGS